MTGDNNDAAEGIKKQLRQDLVEAMKGKRPADAKILRSLLAAIDNAQAPPLPADMKAFNQLPFDQGSAEVQRLSLDADAVRAVLSAEFSERVDAAQEMTRVGRPDAADALKHEADFIRRYL